MNPNPDLLREVLINVSAALQHHYQQRQPLSMLRMADLIDYININIDTIYDSDDAPLNPNITKMREVLNIHTDVSSGTSSYAIGVQHGMQVMMAIAEGKSVPALNPIPVDVLGDVNQNLTDQQIIDHSRLEDAFDNLFQTLFSYGLNSDLLNLDKIKIFRMIEQMVYPNDSL